MDSDDGTHTIRDKVCRATPRSRLQLPDQKSASQWLLGAALVRQSGPSRRGKPGLRDGARFVGVPRSGPNPRRGGSSRGLVADCKPKRGWRLGQRKSQVASPKSQPTYSASTTWDLEPETWG